MSRKLSRRSIAQYVAVEIAKPDPKSRQNAIQQLAAFLVVNRRTKELNSIVRDIEFYLAENGHVAGTVISAHKLSTDTMAAIQQFARQKTGASKVSLQNAVDPAVLGGIKLELPRYQLDATIARHLTTLKTRHKQA